MPTVSKALLKYHHNKNYEVVCAKWIKIVIQIAKNILKQISPSGFIVWASNWFQIQNANIT